MAWDAEHRDKEMDSDTCFCEVSGAACKNVELSYSAEQGVK